VFFPTRSILVIFPAGQATMANPSSARWLRVFLSVFFLSDFVFYFKKSGS
jgi:hypothetical protein